MKLISTSQTPKCMENISIERSVNIHILSSGLQQCWKFLSPGHPRRSGLGLGDMFSEVGSPGGRPEMAISQLL